jgi:hypothetical protein
MILPKSVASLLQDHVTLEVECVDRMYLNVYIPKLQSDVDVCNFFRRHRGKPLASSALMAPISEAFIRALDKFAARHNVPVVHFKKGQRKDDIAKEHLARFTGDEGVLFIGKAQEKARVFRTERRWTKDGTPYPFIVSSSAMVNYYYFYCVDLDFGPFFVKFCTYFPYNGKLCVNGHEYAKRQLAREGIEFQPLDNGIASCEYPERLQQICDRFSAQTIWALFDKWMAVLPQALTQEDRDAGYRYNLSVLQAEFSLTQVFDHAVAGRLFFERVIRENLDIGRPDHVQLIFGRKIVKRTPGRFRTRVVTEGVIPSLHVDYKNSRIKQYHKEGRALRTETTVNDTKDFGLKKSLTDSNLASLREIGFRANRQMLNVQRISHDPCLGHEAIVSMQSPVTVNSVRASALPLASEKTQALLQALPIFDLHANGFSNADLRQRLAPLLGKRPEQLTPGQMTYHLRRLKVRGLIERIPKSHRYRVTDIGLRIALFYINAYDRLLRPGLAQALEPQGRASSQLGVAFRSLNNALDNHFRTYSTAI